jgi:glutathione synthase
MGGTSRVTEVNNEEYNIIETINPLLSKIGVVMYGVDTLIDDDGKRVLSEINTTSIGGISQMAQLKKQSLVEEAVDQIWKYFINKKKNDKQNKL